MFKKVFIKNGKNERKGDFIMKKVISLILSMAMVLSLTVLSFAEGDTTSYTITINESTSGHTYEAYQIFKGDLSGTTLSNIEWGTGVTSEAKNNLGNAADKAKELAAGDTQEIKAANAKAFAEAVAPYLSNTVAGSATVAKNQTSCQITGLAAGYYLIKDKDSTLTGKDESYTNYILKVVDNVTIEPKSDKTKVEKKVQDINDTDGTYTTDAKGNNWIDSADYDIGDLVPFKLTATLANNVSSYDTYKVVFHDTLSKGLTYYHSEKEEDPNNIIIKIGNKDVTDQFTVTTGSGQNGETTLTISCDNVKAEGIGATDNSVITVEYKATLNENAVIGSAGNPNKVYLEYSNNPNKSGSGNNETGETPEDKVIVFTYKTVIDKVGPDKTTPLEGAEFTLEKKINGKWTKIKTIGTDGKTTTFNFEGLDDGDYRLTESKTPAGYNTITPIEFNITAQHSVESDNPVLIDLNGKTDTGEVTFGETAFSVNKTEGSLSAKVVNSQGTELPSTGGIGTTIFYVVGAVLVIGAGVLFVTKRRMSTR